MTILERAADFFTTDEWPIRISENGGLHTAYKGESGQWMCFGCTWESDGLFAFYSICPLVVPQGRLSEMAEFMTRANNNLIMGNFELNYESGEARFKTSIDVQDSSFTVELWRPVVFANVAIMDRYLPGILAVISGAKNAIQAIALVESN